MPWVKLSDDWYDDLDLIEAGPASMLFWSVGITWCARNLTDGFIPTGQLRRLVDWEDLGLDARQVIARLVDVGRVEEVQGGFQIVNYLKYQPSAEQVIAQREKDRARKTRGAQIPDGLLAEAVPGPDCPVPVPGPADDSSSSSSTGSTQVPPGLWKKIAEKQAKATTSKIGNHTAWVRKAAENAKEDHLERAEQLLAMYEISESQLVDVLLAGGTSPLLNSLRRKDAA